MNTDTRRLVACGLFALWLTSLLVGVAGGLAHGFLLAALLLAFWPSRTPRSG